MTPSRIGSYIIEKKIGSGGMGTVYLGRHEKTDEPAAVKVLPASFSREPGNIERFTREIDALKQLTNPHVVRLYESGVDNDEIYYYAMEYVDGETLASRIRREKRIGWRDVIDISVQICSALKAAHDAGFVHRDLKPSNLIFASDGSIKLTDFGVAQVFASSRLTVTGGIIGTAEYMSAEQAQGRRVTKKSDLYSLGAVMYVMLTGRPPFSGKTTLDIVQKHKYAQFDRPRMIVADMPHWLDEIVCQLLEKDPDKRIPDAYVVSRKLQEVVKKVELSMQEKTMAAGFDDLGPTVSAEGRDNEPGMATLMHELVKAEVEHAHRPSTLGTIFNNIWVLLGLLLLLIAGGVYWFSRPDLTPDELFEEGVALMDQPEGPGWVTAREKFFAPLLQSDPQRWEDQVEPYLQQIERYELISNLKKQTRKRLSRNDDPKGEVERFLRLAQFHRNMGNHADAEQILSSLATLIENDEQHRELYKLTQDLLKEWREERKSDPERYAMLEAAMERADKLEAEGKLAEAQKIWRSVYDLYGNDPGAEPLMEKALDALNRTKGK